MDQKNVVFARSWAKRYVRTKRPYGLDEGDVENRILESLYNKDKRRPDLGADVDDASKAAALSEALNAVQNEARRNLRALRPWQVRDAGPHRETQAYPNLARDMLGLRVRQSVRENDRRRVRDVVGMLSPEDRSVALDFMELLSWQKVAAMRGMSEGSFRRCVLAGFVSRFKETWLKIF